MRKQKFKCHIVLLGLNREGNLCLETFSLFKTESKFSRKKEVGSGDVEVHGSLANTEVQAEEEAHRAGSRDNLQRKGLGHMAQACRGAIRKATAQGTGSRTARRISKAAWAIQLDKENVSEWARGFSDC